MPTSRSSVTEQFLHTHPTGIASISQVPGGMTPKVFLEEYYRGQFNAGWREFELTAVPQSIEVARGVQFPAWTFFGTGQWGPTAPGPTLRCSEGDQVRIKFHNGDRHPHTIHLHGIHPGEADGVFETIYTGRDYNYEFTAEPFGLFLYHCHVAPVKKHIEKGLYGAFIVDPVNVVDPFPPTPTHTPTTQPATRPQAREMVMVMNGFDVDFDGENEFYTVNGIANYYLDNPIQIGVGELVRIYLVNMTEFDPVNSFHLHGNMFRLYRTGTRFDPRPEADWSQITGATLDERIGKWLYADRFAEVTDTVFLGQGERAILEFVPKHPGKFLFHAHQSEFLELGWTGLFEVT
jgi:FtsP/CotA-like multicopper oxidase with cupredoxin domain